MPISVPSTASWALPHAVRPPAMPLSTTSPNTGERVSPLLPVTPTRRSTALHSQIGCSHEPHAEKTFTIRLTGSSVPREGVERMTVILDLVAVCIHLYAQFPSEGSRAGGSAGTCGEQRRPHLCTTARAG